MFSHHTPDYVENYYKRLSEKTPIRAANSQNRKSAAQTPAAQPQAAPRENARAAR